MHAVMTNLGAAPVPIACAQGAAWVNTLDPAVPYTVSSVASTVVTVGDSPTLREGLASFFEDLAELLGKLITFWRDRKDAERDGDDVMIVSVRIQNSGTNALRVILGDPTDDRQLDAGATEDYSAPLFIEVRELGV